VAAKKKDITVQHIADEVGLDADFVRDVLKEVPGVQVTRTQADKIFQTARKMGYDFRKLKIGKRMQSRRETLEEVLEKIAGNPEWSRGDVIKYLKESLALVERVHKRVFREEFGEER
jgi:hypothetical protein